MNDHEIDRQARAKSLSDRKLENVTGGRNTINPNNNIRYCPQCGFSVPVHLSASGSKLVCDPKGHLIP